MQASEMCNLQALQHGQFSTSTGRQYTIRNSFTCNSNNIIYLITCTKCKKQYGGYTQTTLKDTINQHRTNITIYAYFSDHKTLNLSVQAIDIATTYLTMYAIYYYYKAVDFHNYMEVIAVSFSLVARILQNPVQHNLCSKRIC